MVYDKNSINGGYLQSVSASCKCIFKEFAAVRVNINPFFQWLHLSNLLLIVYFLLFFYSFLKPKSFSDGKTVAFAQSKEKLAGQDIFVLSLILNILR